METTIITTKTKYENDSDNSASLVQSCILNMFIHLKHTQMLVVEHTEWGKYTHSHTHSRMMFVYLGRHLRNGANNKQNNNNKSIGRSNSERKQANRKYARTLSRAKQRNRETIECANRFNLIGSFDLLLLFFSVFVFSFVVFLFTYKFAKCGASKRASKFISSSHSWAIAVGGFDFDETHLKRNSSVFACACYFDVVVFQQLRVGLPQHTAHNSHTKRTQ